MQRVLSFPPPSRGFGDTSEFVSKRVCFSFMFSLGFLAFLGGFLLGRFVFDRELELSRDKLKKVHLHHREVYGVYKNYSQFSTSDFLNEISESAVRGHLELLTNETKDDLIIRSSREAEILKTHLSSNGFELVSRIQESKTPLTYPSSIFPNEGLIVDERGNIVLKFNDTRERYSRNGPEGLEYKATSEGDVVYVNFGRSEDYYSLDVIGVSVTGNIVLVRAGGIVLSDMVANAMNHGAIGILVYIDPQQQDLKLPLISPKELTELKSFLLLPESQFSALPLLEISSSDAEKIFMKMSKNEPSGESWRGKLNCSYPIGPGFFNSKWKLKMNVNLVEVTKTWFNVLGTMKGSQEPDRFVMLANDMISGNNDRTSTSIIMEVVRVLGELKKKGWKPHRSIAVAFWGMDGPTASLRPQLITKAVTYLKVDSPFDAESDKTLSMATPLLQELFQKSTKTASMNNPSTDIMLHLVPDNLFMQHGVPYLEMESFNTGSNDTLKDITSFWLSITWNLADNHGLPFSLDPYVRFFSHSVQVIKNRFDKVALKHTLYLVSLFAKVEELLNTIETFKSNWAHADKSKSVEMRIMNDQLLDFAKYLIICDRDKFSGTFMDSSQHLIFSKSITGNDDKAGFGVLQDLLREITSTKARRDLHSLITSHISSLIHCIDVALFSISDKLQTLVTEAV